MIWTCIARSMQVGWCHGSSLEALGITAKRSIEMARAILWEASRY